jgi:hypothetical protein
LGNESPSLAAETVTGEVPQFPPAENDPGWVDVRCCGVLAGNICNKLLLRITGEPTVEGIKKAVKIGLDMKCRRCKEINYRVIVI